MVINTLILRGSSAKADDTTKQGAADWDVLAINLIPPKHRANVVGTHIPVSFTETNGRVRPTTPYGTTPQGDSIGQREC